RKLSRVPVLAIPAALVDRGCASRAARSTRAYHPAGCNSPAWRAWTSCARPSLLPVSTPGLVGRGTKRLFVVGAGLPIAGSAQESLRCGSALTLVAGRTAAALGDLPV